MNTGILQMRSNAQVEAAEQAAIVADRQRAMPVLSSLADYVRKAFQEAEQHKQTTGISERLLKSRRLHSGVYESETLQAIQLRGGTELFFNITEPKCAAFEAWMGDVFAPAGDRPWDVVPTPVPALPADLAQRALEATVAEFQGRTSAGQEAQPQDVAGFASDLYDTMLQGVYRDAKRKSERMARKMEDQTVEGGFLDALTQFIKDLSIYPSAILKGPVFVREKRLAWEGGKLGVTEAVVPTWYCVDPQDFFPGPNVRNVNEGYLCERVYFDRRHLAQMRGVPGWDVEALNAVLAQPSPGGKTMQSAEEVERATLEDRDSTETSGLAAGIVDAVQFWGSVSGRLLKEWGLKGVKDEGQYYEADCTMIGELIVRAILNPHPLGHRPYYVTSFAKNRSSLWGVKSLPELMEDCQAGTNGAYRHLLDNLAIASGPMVGVDLDAVPATHVPTINKLWPWKVWPYHGSKTQNPNPIRFFQPSANSAELLTVAQHFADAADDRTLIPRYVTGDERLAGAAATASGLSMLMNAASRGVKRVIRDMDRDVLKPALHDLYVWDMMNLEDDALKGDAQVVARGALAMLTREQTQLRRQEFLQMTNNPTDLQIIGIEGRAALLREIARGLDIPVEDVVPSKDELQKRVQQQMAAQRAVYPEEEPAQVA